MIISGKIYFRLCSAGFRDGTNPAPSLLFNYLVSFKDMAFYLVLVYYIEILKKHNRATLMKLWHAKNIKIRSRKTPEGGGEDWLPALRLELNIKQKKPWIIHLWEYHRASYHSPVRSASPDNNHFHLKKRAVKDVSVGLKGLLHGVCSRPLAFQPQRSGNAAFTKHHNHDGH